MATVQDVIEAPSGSFLLFCEEIAKGAPGLVRLLGDWLANRGSAHRNPAIRRFVLGHEHRVIDTLTMADIKAATEWSRADIPKRHALGESRGTAPHKWLDDFDTPWTFNYQFHGLLDKMKKIPNWDEYENWFFSQGASTYYVPALEELKRRQPSLNKADFNQFLGCLRWRVGCAYYSFLREMHLYTTLRVVYGLPMRYHVLADSQMRIDMWCHNHLLAVCVENKEYRAEQGGRKQRLEDIVRGTRFQVIPVTLGKPTGFGRPHLVSPAEIKRVAEQIRLSAQKAA